MSAPAAHHPTMLHQLRYTPTVSEAAGMLAALQRTPQHTGHDCDTVITAIVTLGDGKELPLRCPYGTLNVLVEVDRRIIASLYADAALEAMRGSRA